MLFKSFEYIKDIERLINNSHSLPIFKGYKAIDKRGVEKLIDEIYATLPVDVQIARQYLRDNNQEIPETYEKSENVYNLLKMLEIYLDDGWLFINNVIVKTKEMNNLLKRLHDSLPEEIQKVQNMNK